MKKTICVFLVILCLIINIKGLEVAATSNIFKQGIFKTADLNPSNSEIYSITNISSKDSMFISILDDNLAVMEAIRILPNSPRVDTVPVRAGYKIIILGKGSVYINPKN